MSVSWSLGGMMRIPGGLSAGDRIWVLWKCVFDLREGDDLSLGTQI